MKQKTLKEAVVKYYENNIDESNIPREHYESEIQDLMIGFAYQWQQEQDKKLYSEEEVYIILEKFRNLPLIQFQEWFEQFKNK